MSTQYLTDETGKTTGVFIPINQWNLLKDSLIESELNLMETPEWHIKEIESRNEMYMKNPEIGLDLFQVLDELESEL